LFETQSPAFDPSKATSRGKLFTLTRDITGNGRIDFKDLEWEYLQGDGDFRSSEVTALRDEADIVVTNAPFSLFREYVAWLVEADKKFLVIGNMNAITYKEIFPHIRDNKMWLGTGANMSPYFYVPAGFHYAPTYKGDKEREGRAVCQVPAVCWFTNLDHGRRHEPLTLMTMADNLKFSKHKQIRGKASYDKYDNYDAIEVPFTNAIPSDYTGVMGVPISFLDKYNPDQFEILGSQRWAKSPALTVVYTGKKTAETDYKTLVDKKETYDRIFIRHRDPA
jgi:hypothetical protein